MSTTTNPTPAVCGNCGHDIDDHHNALTFCCQITDAGTFCEVDECPCPDFTTPAASTASDGEASMNPAVAAFVASMEQRKKLQTAITGHRFDCPCERCTWFSAGWNARHTSPVAREDAARPDGETAATELEGRVRKFIANSPDKHWRDHSVVIRVAIDFAARESADARKEADDLKAERDAYKAMVDKWTIQIDEDWAISRKGDGRFALTDSQGDSHGIFDTPLEALAALQDKEIK